jgi:hypothetical protein
MKTEWKRAAGIFLLGLLLGSSGSLYACLKFMVLYGQGKLNDRLLATQMRAYSCKFNLTADQKPKVSGLLQVQLIELRSLRAAAARQRDNLRRSTHQKIRLLLNPDQLPKFDQFVEKEEHRIRAIHAALGID